ITSGPTTSLEGDSITYQGSFADPGLSHDADYTYTWGVIASNGQLLTPLTGAVADSTFTPQDKGSIASSPVSDDEDGASSVAAQQDLTVSNVAPTASIAGPSSSLEGESVTFQGSFADPGLSHDADYTYTLSVAASNGQFVTPLTGTGAVSDFTFTPQD